MRFAAGLAYNGAAYAGWQMQATAMSIQAKVESAFSKVANASITTVCAGRTDAGVHALGQVIHFDTQAKRTEYAWQAGANSYLPRDISVHWVRQVPDDFNARFSAISRTYRYYLLTNAARPGVFADQMSWHLQPLNLSAMQEACQYLRGEHDFHSFRSAHCQAKTSRRRIEYLQWEARGSLFILTIRANAFLHHMVRNIVGASLEIGTGKQSPDWMAEVLAARDRQAAAVTARPEGLYLTEVQYPKEMGLPSGLLSCVLENVSVVQTERE